MKHVTRRNWSGDPWALITSLYLTFEQEQALDEGKDLSLVKAELDKLVKADLSDEESLCSAEALLDYIQALPQRDGYPYREPSDLPGILSERPPTVSLPPIACSDAELKNRMLAGWAGRCSGCMLGKPLEGRLRWQIEKYLKTQGRWPLSAYVSGNAPDELKEECGLSKVDSTVLEEGICCMTEDDDTNYTVVGLALVKKHGTSFTPEDVAKFWLENIPAFHLATAERIAYKNLLNWIAPPDSASYRNPCREWIGAQIRADFFGYVNPGNPQRAAEFAWRDASISHIKNGIYGEMWVAAMLAAAYVLSDVQAVIRAGLAQIPAESRLTAAVERIISMRHKGLSYDEVIADFISRWQEDKGHHWCHTISNAEIVAIALLWGEMDFEKTICGSVMPGFDTDCNGATSGSVLGVMLGADRLPPKWISPLNDTLLTGVSGYHKVSLTQMADETLALARSMR